MPDRDRRGCRDNPADVLRVLVPQLYPKCAHRKYPVQVRVRQFAHQFVDPKVEIGRRAADAFAFGAQLFNQAERVQPASCSDGWVIRTKEEHFWQVKRRQLNGAKVLADKRGTERSWPFPETFFRGHWDNGKNGRMNGHGERQRQIA
jgi:hypothetical protein